MLMRCFSKIIAVFVNNHVRLAFIVSVILHVGGLYIVLHTAGLENIIYGDAKGYIELAQHIKDGIGFVAVIDGEVVPEVFRSPGLPTLLVPFVGTSAGIMWYLFIQSIVAAIIIPFLVWKIANHLFSTRVGAVSLWLVSIEPLFLFFGWLPLTEIPFIVFCLCAVFFLEQALRLVRTFPATLAGLCFVVAVYIRPGNVVVIYSAMVVLLLWYLFSRQFYRITIVFITGVVLFLGLLPWYVRVSGLTGEFALAGTGWRNVYTDYLASVRSLEKGTTFWDEKEQLKQEALPRFGLSRFDLGNPAYASILRDAALNELLHSPVTVIKLQIMLYVSFFTNDGWYSYLRRFQILPEAPRSSATLAVLEDGLVGVMRVLGEMKGQFFIPIFGRMYTSVLLFAAFLYGVFFRNRVSYFFGFIFILSATASSVIGLGVEARLRTPIVPFLLMFSAGGLVLLYETMLYRFLKTNKHSK